MTQPESSDCDWGDIINAFPLKKLWVTHTLNLRPLTKQDSVELGDFLSGDPEMTWTRKPWSRRNVDYLLSLRLSHYKQYGFGPYGIELDGKLIGMAGVQVWDYEPCSVEFLVYVAKSQWNQGYGTNLTKWIIDKCNDIPSLPFLYAATRPENTRINHIVKQLGFMKTGNGEHYGYPSIYWKRACK